MVGDLENIRRGDWHAFHRLAAPHQARLYGLSYRALGEEQAALAAAQDGLRLAAQNIRQFNGGPFELWLLRWVVAACREHLGRNAVCPLQPLSAAERSPEQALQRELCRLPAEMRLAILLVDVARLNYAEASAVLGTTLAQVRQQVAQARGQLMSQTANNQLG